MAAKLEKIKFDEGPDFKVCPVCGYIIYKNMKHSYENEWCPSCEVNHEIVFPDKYRW